MEVFFAFKPLIETIVFCSLMWYLEKAKDKTTTKYTLIHHFAHLFFDVFILSYVLEIVGFGFELYATTDVAVKWFKCFQIGIFVLIGFPAIYILYFKLSKYKQIWLVRILKLIWRLWDHYICGLSLFVKKYRDI